MPLSNPSQVSVNLTLPANTTSTASSVAATPTFQTSSKIGIGGYLGQMLPEASKRSGDLVYSPRDSAQYLNQTSATSHYYFT